MRLVMYSTLTCGQCRFVKPILQELYPAVEVVTLNESSPEIETLQITTVPFIVAYDVFGGVIKTIGAGSKATLKAFLEEVKFI